jgi:hypothetical protein
MKIAIHQKLNLLNKLHCQDFFNSLLTNKYIYSSACDTEDTDDSKEPSPEPVQKPQQQPPPQPPLGKPPLHPQTLRGLIPKGGFKRVGPEIQQRIKEVCKYFFFYLSSSIKCLITLIIAVGFTKT